LLLVKSGGVSSSGDTKKWAGVEIVNGSGCSIQKNEVLKGSESEIELKYEGQNWPGLAKFQPATEIYQLQ
jgi:hypothetical protein